MLTKIGWKPVFWDEPNNVLPTVCSIANTSAEFQLCINENTYTYNETVRRADSLVSLNDTNKAVINEIIWKPDIRYKKLS